MLVLVCQWIWVSFFFRIECPKFFFRIECPKHDFLFSLKKNVLLSNLYFPASLANVNELPDKELIWSELHFKISMLRFDC